jgi:hypothetical protein
MLLTSVSPSGGTTGDKITFSGTGFNGVLYPSINGTHSFNNVRVNSPTEMTGTVPSGIRGLVDITMYGSESTLADSFHVGVKDSISVYGAALGSRKFTIGLVGTFNTASRGNFGYPRPVRFLTKNIVARSSFDTSRAISAGIDPRVIQSIYISPTDTVNLTRGEYLQFECFGVLSGEEIISLVHGVKWNSTDTGVGRISDLGLFYARDYGTTYVTARILNQNRVWVRGVAEVKVR